MSAQPSPGAADAPTPEPASATGPPDPSQGSDTVDVQRLRELLHHHLPAVRLEGVVRLGSGMDHEVYEINGALVLRLDLRPDPASADRLRREIRLLHAVAAVSPVPTPTPIHSVPDLGVLVWPRLDGVSLLDLGPRERLRLAVPVAVQLGALLARLHGLPEPLANGYAITDSTSLDDRRDEAAEEYAVIEDELSSQHRRAVQTFLATAPPQPTPTKVLCHNDLGIEHVLVDPAGQRVTGVIDWADAAVVDAARDFGLLLRDLGPDALRSALEVYSAHGQDPTGVCDRAFFYARCGAVEDLAYAVTTGRLSYREKTLHSLSWLFA